MKRVAEEVEVALLKLYPGKTPTEKVEEEEQQLKRAMAASLEDCDPVAQAVHESKRQRHEPLECKLWGMTAPERRDFFATRKESECID